MDWHVHIPRGKSFLEEARGGGGHQLRAFLGQRSGVIGRLRPAEVRGQLYGQCEWSNAVQVEWETTGA